MVAATFAVIKFSAPWCAPCRACAPQFYKLKSDYNKNTPGLVDFYEVDVDNDDSTSSAYMIKSLPTFVLLVNGLEASRIIGANVDNVRSELSRLIKSMEKEKKEVVVSPPVQQHDEQDKNNMVVAEEDGSHSDEQEDSGLIKGDDDAPKC